MAINTENDIVEVFHGAKWFWHRKDADNGKIVAIGGEGYNDRAYCIEAAQAYCPGVPLRVDTGEGLFTIDLDGDSGD